MSLSRRLFDPIRSQWYYDQPHRQTDLPIEQGIGIYLRLDDVYSYLAVQQIKQLNDILVDTIKPLKIFISEKSATPPNGMTQHIWQNYCLKDAKILAMQHRFAYDELPEMPSNEAIAHAKYILEQTPLKGDDFYYLLEDIFHMLWNQQYAKLRMLYTMAVNHPNSAPISEFQYIDTPILTAYFEFGERKYHAVDDLLRLTRRLQQQKLLTESPIFLINHIEWGEHLIQDAQELAEIQALHAHLDLYICFEDPFSWLLLAYIKEHLADIYNIQLNYFPLPYQKRDEFDWSLATRLSKRTEVPFTPFCRPDQNTTNIMLDLFYRVDPHQRNDLLFEMFKRTWSKGQDLSQAPLRQALEQDFNFSTEKDNNPDIQQYVQANLEHVEQLQQPDLPVMVLKVAEKTFVFNSLYRVWMIESIFSRLLEQQQYQHNKDFA